MSKPAAFLGTYTDLKFMSGLKVARVVLEFPIERAEEFIGMFGTPNKADPAWCAIARMQVGALSAPKENGPDQADGPVAVTAGVGRVSLHAEPAKDQDTPRTYTRSQKAALKCQDEDFQKWVELECARRCNIAFRPNPGSQVTASELADIRLKELLDIASKKELDADDHKAAAWDALITDFELRDMVR